MKIDFVRIKNFRKLKSCKIEFSDKETIFVGANNSGKTTAMDAIIKFLKKSKFSTRDFTLSNWLELNKIGESWLTEKDFAKQDLTIDNWQAYLLSLDIWLHIKKNEIHYVNNLIPTLDWNGGLIGVRLRLEPNNIEELFKEFKSTCENSKKIVGDKKIQICGQSIYGIFQIITVNSNMQQLTKIVKAYDSKSGFNSYFKD